MKIYDCFIFFNELDLLEIRLKTLEKVVDYFVLVEATKTHRGKEKPLFFNENKSMFKRWESKIIHVVVEDMPKMGRSYGSNWKVNSFLKGGPWKLEAYQKRQIVRGLKRCRDEDIIMMSDLDEIPNPKKIPEMVKALGKEKVILFSQNLYYFFLNGFTLSGWTGTRACTFKTLRRCFLRNMDWYRHLWNVPLRVKMFLGKKIYIIKDGGWHFSYLGNEKFIINKISSSAHFEKEKPEFTDSKKIREKMNSGIDPFNRNLKIKYTPIDSSFPDEIVKNQKKYSKFIKKA
jgi:beta-1,4-mannosyl-glycoprotein beta-1,4-N-acetylglucosaminyltransferase